MSTFAYKKGNEMHFISADSILIADAILRKKTQQPANEYVFLGTFTEEEWNKEKK